MPQKKGDLTPLVQYVVHSLLRFGRSFDDELLVIAKLLQPALNVCGGILQCLIIQDACMTVQKRRANFSNKFFFCIEKFELKLLMFIAFKTVQSFGMT
jgi:hypothetical protein